jgi:predicted alpha/beta-hydrolase family hydrolase
MTNSSWCITHTCELGLPTTAAYGVRLDSLGTARRVASPRVRPQGTVMPISTGDVSLQADWAAVAGVAVKDAFAFPGPSTWSPPI